MLLSRVTRESSAHARARRERVLRVYMPLLRIICSMFEALPDIALR